MQQPEETIGETRSGKDQQESQQSLSARQGNGNMTPAFERVVVCDGKEESAKNNISRFSKDLSMM